MNGLTAGVAERVHHEGKKQLAPIEGSNFNYMVKRFKLEACPMTTDFNLLSDHPDTHLVEFFATKNAKVIMEYQVGREVQKET